MKRASLLLLLLLITLNMYSQTIINGNLSSIENWSNNVYLLAINDYTNLFSSTNKYNIDTAIVDLKGNFQFKLKKLPCVDCLYRIDIRPKDAKGAFLFSGSSKENYALFELKEGQSIEIKGDANQLTKSFSVTSKLPAWDYRHLRNLRTPFYNVADSIMQLFAVPEKLAGLNIDSLKEVNINKIIIASIENNKILKEFIHQSPNIYDKIISLLLYDFDSKMDNDIEFYELVLKQIKKDYPKHPFCIQLEKNIYETKYVLPIGSTTPPLILPDSSGNDVNLFELESNLILIDFWASWCSPCRHENRMTVKPLYEKYKNKGFMVFSVSMDSNREKWINAMKADKMNWINVSDLKAEESPIYKTYKIDGLPTTYLIDKKDNKIIAKNIRGEDLKKFVENYYAKK